MDKKHKYFLLLKKAHKRIANIFVFSWCMTFLFSVLLYLWLDATLYVWIVRHSLFHRYAKINSFDYINVNVTAFLGAIRFFCSWTKMHVFPWRLGKIVYVFWLYDRFVISRQNENLFYFNIEIARVSSQWKTENFLFNRCSNIYIPFST